MTLFDYALCCQKYLIIPVSKFLNRKCLNVSDFLLVFYIMFTMLFLFADAQLCVNVSFVLLSDCTPTQCMCGPGDTASLDSFLLFLLFTVPSIL